ncbi:MAG: hypothetical protein EOO14_06275 [Chitinophagaceae bacterium]|nr:MAG: hypothetical protein EOO14_06275 [Chitinophagaceae bacterium]
MKRNNRDEQICILYIIITFLIYLSAMTYAMISYDNQPIKQEIALRGRRIRNGLRNLRSGRRGKRNEELVLH